ncbi:hypothetical protein [Rhodoplanes sp. SY1]|uniref:hypothetical protein n=1 Tax=Rhodoplanes sp. SY1 TaxID=3166646 RepID=UPI0038B65A02
MKPNRSPNANRDPGSASTATAPTDGRKSVRGDRAAAPAAAKQLRSACRAEPATVGAAIARASAAITKTTDTSKPAAPAAPMSAGACSPAAPPCLEDHLAAGIRHCQAREHEFRSMAELVASHLAAEHRVRAIGHPYPGLLFQELAARVANAERFDRKEIGLAEMQAEDRRLFDVHVFEAHRRAAAEATPPAFGLLDELASAAAAGTEPGGVTGAATGTSPRENFERLVAETQRLMLVVASLLDRDLGERAERDLAAVMRIRAALEESAAAFIEACGQAAALRRRGYDS